MYLMGRRGLKSLYIFGIHGNNHLTVVSITEYRVAQNIQQQLIFKDS